MTRTWSARPQGAIDCVSPAAAFWRWAQDSYGAQQFPSAVWYRSWDSQAIAFETDGMRRLLLLALAGDGSWTAQEWRWKPSDRPPTRRWQEGRWNLLLDASKRFSQAAPEAANEPAWRPLMAAWTQSIGPAAGEVAAGQWRWVSDGRCMAIEAAGAVEGSFQLPHLVEDSRLEQRSAMQLQLARRHPGAVWLKPFSLLESSRQRKDGIARYKAVWLEQGVVHGQLWIPAKGDGPVLRLRLGTPAKPAQGAAGGGAAAQAVERELERLGSLVGKIDG